ncbi:hypothetical protein, partial [Helicobacter brantae]
MKTSKTLYKPLIASSLAIALGVSVAVAQPRIQLGWSGDDSSSTLGINWQSTDSYYQAQYVNGNTNIQNLTFSVKKNGSISNTLNGGNYTASIGIADGPFLIQSDKGIQVGNGTGTLTVGIGNNTWNSGNNRNIILKLGTNAINNTYALYGNLSIENFETGGTNATFGGKGIKGNLSLKSIAGTNNLTFTGNDAEITGNVTLVSGTTTINGLSILQGNITARNVNSGATINFTSDTTIAGDILTSQNGGYDSVSIITATQNLTFGNGTNSSTIQSNAETYRQTKNLIKASNITFEQTGIIASNNTAWANQGNKINILSSSSMSGTLSEITSAMNGTIAQNGDASRVYNVLSLEGDSVATTDLTIEAINKKATLDSKGGYSGNNYIIKGITTGSNGSLALNSTIFNNGTWKELSHQANINLTITGDIFTNNGANYINVKSLTANTITANGGSNNIVAGNGTSSGANSISGNISANGGNNSITLGEANSSNSIAGNISTSNGTNTLTFNGISNAIEGNISVNASGGLGNLKNIIVANSGGMNFGKSNGTQTILAKVTGWESGNSNIFNISGNSTFKGNTAIIARNQSAWGSSGSSNIFKFGGTATNGDNAKITEVSSVGTWQDFANGVTASNILSFDQTSNSSLLIGAINSKGTISGDQTGNTYIGKGITKGSGNTLALMDNFASSWSESSHQANINLTISDGVFTNRGANYINVNQIILSGGITANGGSNNIVAGSGTSGANSISGNISAGNGTNSITFNNTFNNNETNSISGNISVNGDGRNTISSTGSLNIGTSSSITLTAQWGQNNITSSGSITLGSDSNKVALNAYGNAATNVAQNSIVASGSLTGHFSTLSVYDNNNGNGHHKNIITGGSSSNITIDSMSATRHANNINSITVGESSSIAITGDITTSNGAKNNFTLSGDSSTLTLKGSSSAITTLTAFASATTGNTLTLDATSNESVVASIGTLTNGDKLKVDFKGIDTSKSTQLTLNTANATSLKSISVTSGTNNTLVLSGTGTTAISEKVTIEADKGIIFGLAGGASLTFSQNLETQASGSTSFNLGGTNTLTGTLTNNGTHNFVIKNNATLKYSDGLAFSSGTNTITFDTDNKTLSWQNTNGESKDISTSGGTTNINFNSDNGVLNTGVNTTATTTTINIATNKSGTIKGNITQSDSGANNAVFNGGTAKLTLQGSSNALSSVTANDAGILSLDGAGSQSGVQATITTLTGNNLTANFNGNQTKEAKLILSNGNGTLAGVTLGANSTNNTLSLQNGKTTISGAISVGANQGITFELANNTELSLGGGMSGAGDSVLKVAENGSVTLSGTEAITLNTANLSGDNSSTLTLKTQTIDIATLNANAKGGNTLTLDSSSNNVSATLHNIVGNLDVELNSASNASTLTLNGGTIQSISATNGGADKNLAVFSSGSNVIASAINSTSVATDKGLTLQVNSGATLHAQGGINNSSAGAINVALNGGTLTFGTNSNHISQLSGNGGRVDLANDVQAISSRQTMPTRKTLVVDNYTSENTTFNLFVSSSQNDQITLSNGGSNAKAILTLKGEMDVYDITYSNHTNANNTLVAKASNNIAVESGISLIGVNDVVMDLVSVVNQNDNTTDYYIGKVVDLGVDPVFQEIASTALTVNYDLFLANFNSLNKRMGELRESEHSNGVWARVFGGSMSNDFGSGSRTDYVTAQAGYDYSLSIGENARNFMGIALAYGTSNTKGNTLALNTNGASSNSVALDKVNSNMIEVGLYNSYVADSGWYNDTIFKFDYIMSEFSFSTDPTRMSETNNFAMVLSDEFGYRYSFGESEKGSWYIDPQVEVAFGYFNQ